MIPENLKYAKSHEWVKIDGKKAVFGITDHAIDEIRDIIFLELKGVGEQVEQGKPFGTIESVKAVFELFSPVSGRITAVNQAVLDKPELLTMTEAYGKGWLAEVEVKDASETGKLMDAKGYDEFLRSESSAH